MLSWKDIFSQNWSRKAGVAVITIVAIYLIATQQIEEGKTLSIEICKCGMYLIGGVGCIAIILQFLLDLARLAWTGESNDPDILLPRIDDPTALPELLEPTTEQPPEPPPNQ